MAVIKKTFQFYLISTFSQYTKPDGNVSWLGVTQFESTGARKSFPCLDEPDKKAKFNVKINRKSSLSAVSNMPINKTESLENDMEVDQFENSVVMSTYLLAFLVSDFDNTGSFAYRVS